MMAGWLRQGLVTLVIVSAALLGYDRIVVRPAHQVGIVNLTAVYEEQERVLAERLGRTGGPNALPDHDAILAEAKRFADSWPKAFRELAADCQCGVIVPDGTVLGGVATVDLTPQFREKVGLK